MSTLTPYNYSFNNPIRFNDPLGDCPECNDGPSGSGPSIGNLAAQAGEVFNIIVGFLFGDGNDGSVESAAQFGQAMEKAPVLEAASQETKSNIEGELGQVPGLNVALNVMDAGQAKTTGGTLQHLGKAGVNANSIPVFGVPLQGAPKPKIGEAGGPGAGKRFSPNVNAQSIR